jgi:hypothetical protein
VLLYVYCIVVSAYACIAMGAHVHFLLLCLRTTYELNPAVSFILKQLVEAS